MLPSVLLDGELDVVPHPCIGTAKLKRATLLLAPTYLTPGFKHTHAYRFFFSIVVSYVCFFFSSRLAFFFFIIVMEMWFTFLTFEN